MRLGFDPWVGKIPWRRQSTPVFLPGESRGLRSLAGFSVHGISQERILEWVAMPFSRGSSQPKDQTHISYVSCTGRRVLYHKCHVRQC